MKKIILLITLVSSMLFAQSAEEIVDTNGCLACHAVAGKKTAPAFAGIAKKNKRFDATNAKNNIIDGIKNGSKGKFRRFADAEMPAYPHLSADELNLVADYILSQSSKARGRGGNGGGQGSRMGMNQ
ncbi:MAG: c-type cytochrome [Campylobacterota bacterium]|nr:c-type cytochrome [Campylobacterota bacterium]